jgi:hypothetical protein
LPGKYSVRATAKDGRTASTTIEMGSDPVRATLVVH